ncbi:MAG: glycosyltransferase family 39 protein, partial [Flavobacteriales bacterium]|nr:glycosyltransferase family 39 protein [Flavobacteriales bacterium]
MNENIKNLLLDIRFYLLLFFVLRLYGITDAPLESSHSWRQCITNTIARNFSEMGLDLMHPRVDLGGEKTGILGSEFPLLNALIYLGHSIFGFQHWYGRLINLLVSTTGLYFFYQLIRNLYTKKLAFHSTLLLTLSVWFMFSRKIMPDTFSVSLVIIGLYFAYAYLKKGNWKNLLLYFLFCTLGILCKIPALSIFSVIVSVLFIKNINFKRKWNLLILGAISILIISAWYFLWVPHLVSTYHYQLYISKGLLEGIQEIKPLFGRFLKRFYFDAFHSFVAFACFLGGIIFLLKNKQSILLKCLGIITTIFILFICKTGNVFPLHSYYIIPFVPVMALVAGYFLTQIPIKIQYVLLAIIAIESIANQHHDLRIKERNRVLTELEDKVDQFIPKDDLIITSGGRAPQNMYFAHRKGWVAFDHNVMRKKFTDSLANIGAKYLLIKK